MGKRSFKQFVEQELGGVAHFLIYATLEWSMIALLFIDGFLVFFTNEFAKFFELETPCLLCTRIDHLLVHRNHDFYYNESICEDHKRKVSTFAFCHTHKKLSNIRKMCERCLLSFVTEKESDCETYKSLIGILHKDIDIFFDDDQDLHLSSPTGKKDGFPIHQAYKSGDHFCSCCCTPLKATPAYARGRKAAFLSSSPAPSPRALNLISKNDANKNLTLSNFKLPKFKLGDKDLENQRFGEEPISMIRGKEDEEGRNLNMIRGNKFFGIPLTDSGTNTPRWATRHPKIADSADMTATNEGDNESVLHQWKRQAKLDSKSLIELYMELDEERNASAVAANNAMAMITRLQTEKAALQMDALQYQRIVEEQAEYDEEAFQEMNDYISRREEEIKDREAELYAYRAKYGCLEDEFVDEGEAMALVQQQD